MGEQSCHGAIMDQKKLDKVKSNLSSQISEDMYDRSDMSSFTFETPS